MNDPRRSCMDLAWLWTMWGGASDEYAHYGRRHAHCWTLGAASARTSSTWNAICLHWIARPDFH